MTAAERRVHHEAGCTRAAGHDGPCSPADESFSPLPVLELAQRFAAQAQQIAAVPRDPHNLVAEKHAAMVQHQYAEMSAQLALVSIAESLDAISRQLSTAQHPAATPVIEGRQ